MCRCDMQHAVLLQASPATANIRRVPRKQGVDNVFVNIHKGSFKRLELETRVNV